MRHDSLAPVSFGVVGGPKGAPVGMMGQLLGTNSRRECRLRADFVVKVHDQAGVNGETFTADETCRNAGTYRFNVTLCPVS